MTKTNQELALNMARDLCQKLLERRLLGPGQLPEAISLLGTTGYNLLAKTVDKNIPILRLSGEITGRLIEKGRLAGAQAAATNIGDNADAIFAASAILPAKNAPIAIKTAQNLVLKLLETNALGPKNIPETLLELSKAAGKILQ